MKPPHNDPAAVAWLEMRADEDNRHGYRGSWPRLMFEEIPIVMDFCLEVERDGYDCCHGSRHFITKPYAEEELDEWVRNVDDHP